jgi:hypothetical protein
MPHVRLHGRSALPARVLGRLPFERRNRCLQ